MTVRVAFAGFQHNHVFAVAERVRRDPRCEAVAFAEDDPAVRAQVAADHAIGFTHANVAAMLAEVDCDLVVVADIFGRRGGIVIDALRRGRHVLSDKPLCTTLDQWRQIDALARQRGAVVIAQLDLRCHGPFITMRRLIREGSIGQVLTLNILGQHPLKLERRPAWYLEPQAHGGTLNDIAVHALDFIPWLIGAHVDGIEYARVWGGDTIGHPTFNRCGQLVIRAADARAMCDVSYIAPDTCGYSVPQYWRVTVSGTGGVLEASLCTKHVMVARSEDPKPRMIDGDPSGSMCYYEGLLGALTGQPVDGALTTAETLTATRWALEAQSMADEAPATVCATTGRL